MMTFIKNLVALLKINPTLETRTILLFYFLIFWMIAISGRLSFVQVAEGEKLRMMARAQRVKQSRTKKRGTVVTKNNWLLATTVTKQTVYINPYYFDVETTGNDSSKLINESHDAAVSKLCAAIRLEKSAFIAMVRKAKAEGKRYLPLVRRLPDEAAREINILKKESYLDWLHLRDELVRVYPNGKMAAHTLGFVGADHNGMAGIEKFYEEKLSIVELLEINRDRLGRAYRNQPDESKRTNIVTTLDERVQLSAEFLLEQITKKFGAKRASVIVMNAANGEISALANYPSYNLNSFNIYNGDDFRNLAISSPYLIPELSAPVIREAGNSTIDFTKSERGCIALYERIMPKMREMGLGSRTDIDLPGESFGALKPRQFATGDKCALSEILEVGATPMQINRLVAAAVNNGSSVTPHVLLKTVTDENEVLSSNLASPNKLISEDSAQAIKGYFKKIKTDSSLDGYINISKTTYLYSDPDDDGKDIPGVKKPAILVTGYASDKNQNFVVTLGIEEPQEMKDVSAPTVKFYEKLFRAIYSGENLR